MFKSMLHRIKEINKNRNLPHPLCFVLPLLLPLLFAIIVSFLSGCHAVLPIAELAIEEIVELEHKSLMAGKPIFHDINQHHENTYQAHAEQHLDFIDANRDDLSQDHIDALLDHVHELHQKSPST